MKENIFISVKDKILAKYTSIVDIYRGNDYFCQVAIIYCQKHFIYNLYAQLHGHATEDGVNWLVKNDKHTLNDNF